MNINNLLRLYLMIWVSCTTINIGHAQLQASNWYFGFNAGLNFDPSTGVVSPLLNGQLNTNEGCASISDDNGNLLFYTDGITVFDRNHLIMQNGQGLRGNPSSTQSAIIIPKPLDPNIYYIFTVDTASTGGNDSGLHWYEVDITANLGQGAVMSSITNPNNLLATCSEKITAINHSVNDEILVTTLAAFNGISNSFDTFYTYTIDQNGVNPIPVKSQVSSSITGGGRRGNLKISPDGQHLVSCNMGSGTYLYDYDQLTGAVSNERPLQFTGQNRSGYGVEFSPDSRLLYITASNDSQNSSTNSHFSTLFQFDLTDPNPNTSGIEIDTRNGYRGSLQLGIDNRIYRALSNSYDVGHGFLGVINNPNTRGIGCNYVHDAIPLGGRLSTQGLPPFIQSYFALIDIEFTCLGDNTSFSFQSDTPPTSVLWDFGDGNTSVQQNPTHVYNTPGTYNVILTLDINGSIRTYRQNVQIYQSPVANPATDISLCDLANDATEIIDLTDTTTQILDQQDPNLFTIIYYNNQTDADSRNNPITVPYTVNQTNQTIIARIENNNNQNCYNTTSLSIALDSDPIANTPDDLHVCDDNFDGFLNFDLSQQTPLILDNQSLTDFEISYHNTQADADSGTNPLPTSYTNTTAFNQTIFVRVVNNNNTNCIAFTTFDLIINPKPVAMDTTLFQCDQDGTPDGITQYNLSQFDDTITDNTTGVTVSYHNNISDADNNIAAINPTSFTNSMPSQTLIARVTDNITGCYTNAFITLSTSASDAQDTTINNCDNDGTLDGITEFTLTDADAAVLINAPANLTLSYYQNSTDALLEQNPLPNNYQNTQPNSQIIYARAESEDGNCFGISEVTLIVNELPQITPVTLVDYCGNDPQPLTIDAGIINGSINDYTYLWSTDETSYEIQVNTGTDYTVQVTDTNGCTSNRTVTVIISDQATIQDINLVHAGTNSTGSATATVTGLGDYEYRIHIDQPYQDQPVFNNLTPGLYTLYVRDKNGCGTVTQDFSIIGYPRYFTPNQDNIHDYWQLIGTTESLEPNAQIYIYDRYGKLLKQLAADGIGWDGTFQGQIMPSNDYWFKTTLSDGTVFSSHFSLKR